MQLPTANNFFVVPGVQNRIHDFFHVIQIRFGLQRIVDAVVSRIEKLIVIHLRGIVAKMR